MLGSCFMSNVVEKDKHIRGVIITIKPSKDPQLSHLQTTLEKVAL